jgi:hypothetical protein
MLFFEKNSWLIKWLGYIQKNKFTYEQTNDFCDKFHAFLGTIVYCEKVINVTAIVNIDMLVKFSVLYFG